MSRKPLVPLMVLLAAPAANAQKSLRIDGREIRYAGLAFDAWGIQLPDWRPIVEADDKLRAVLAPLCGAGVNTIGVALQGPASVGRLFAEDGSIADAKRAESLTALAKAIRDHTLVLVVSPFSIERDCWLSSADAYRKAAQGLAKQVGRKRSVVVGVGDVFAGEPWPADAPFPFGDAERVLELCRLIREANPEVLLAIPAEVVPAALQSKSSPPMCFVADDLARLEKILRDRGVEKPEAVEGLVPVPKERFLRWIDVVNGPLDALPAYLAGVTHQRLAIEAPPPAPSSQASGAADEILSAEEKAEGFEPLFDGRTLTGWTTLRGDWQSWSAENGAIHCSGKGGHWLRCRRRFQSFVLRLEYRIVPTGNSGVFFWAPLDGRASHFGMELQILGEKASYPGTQAWGAIYEGLPPLEPPPRAEGEWNSVEIACRGPRVKVTINGRIVQDFDADKVPALKGRLREGVIGLQDHASEAWFRRIRIKPL